MRDYLRDLRINQNLTQLEVAKKLNVSESYYCMIETGDRQKKLDIDMAWRLADALGTTLEYICDQERE